MAYDDIDKHVCGDDNTNGDNEIFISCDDGRTFNHKSEFTQPIVVTAIAALAIVAGVIAVKNYRSATFNM